MKSVKPAHKLGVLVASFIVLGLLGTQPAFAQMGSPGGGMMPGMSPGGGMRPPSQSGGDHEEGPAEAAPDNDKDDDENAPLAPLSEAARRRTEVLELDGYFRMRTDWLHNLNLGQGYVTDGTTVVGTPPFPVSLDCDPMKKGCKSKNLGSANMRLRLEPTINISDQVRVLAQIDVLDNVIAGSTPDSLTRTDQVTSGSGVSPNPILSNSQNPPEVGQNGYVSSVRAKRAWGEVDTEFGTFKFGRMPWHFGRGMLYNAGRCLDCDGGTTVDRLMVMSKLWGHDVAAAWDYGAQGFVANATTLGVSDRSNIPLDLGQGDDTEQMMVAITKMQSEDQFRSEAGRGELAFNYGAQLVYRSTKKAVTNLASGDPAVPVEGNAAFTPRQLADPGTTALTTVNALALIPSFWFKLGWKALTIEFETNAVLGKIGNAGDLTADTTNKKLDLRQLGWVFASDLSLFKNALFVGLETGGATGDRAEPRVDPTNPNTYLNYRWRNVQQQPGDHAITNFHFSPEYHVDQILFRQILGTVSNAIYIKPQMAYWLNLAEQKQLGINGAIIYSAAAIPKGTPGDARNLGIESNLGLTYRNPADGFYAGATWAVLWPLAGLDRPSTEANPIWPAGNTIGASSAQVIRFFFGIQF